MDFCILYIFPIVSVQHRSTDCPVFFIFKYVCKKSNYVSINKKKLKICSEKIQY